MDWHRGIECPQRPHLRRAHVAADRALIDSTVPFTDRGIERETPAPRERVANAIRYLRPARILKGILCLVNSRWIDAGGGRILHEDWRVPLQVQKQPGARITLRGDLRIASHQGDHNAVLIEMARDSNLEIDGDLVVMQGTKIILSRGASLYIGGNDGQRECGITGNCRIMVRKKVHIGKDFLCSWNVFITDCDWHSLDGRLGQKETYIGDHVWVTCNCSILKGSRIGPGCVLANGTVVHQQEFGPNELVAGNPATARRRVGTWAW